jgi:uncharacterized protein
MNKILIAVLALMTAVSAGAASFDCRKAKNPNEKMICGDVELNLLDEELATAYAEALASSANAGSIRSAHRRWSRQVQDSCSNEECLAGAMYSQIARLRLDPSLRAPLFAATPPLPSIFGRYRRMSEACYDANHPVAQERLREEAASGAAPRTVQAGEPLCFGEVESFVDVRAAAGNAAHVNIQLNGHNGHSCSVNGSAEWVDERLRVVMFDAANPASDCVLLLNFDNGVWIRDPGVSCRKLCGAGVAIDGAEFHRP